MWTGLEATPLWIAAQEQYALPAGRHYHNFRHVERLYLHAHNLQLPYDYDLDLAILAHDVIYDNLPHKELRSIEWLISQGASTADAETHIRRTIDHTLDDDDCRLILLDLLDMAFPVVRSQNYKLICQECIELYEITEEQFADANRDFMTNLLERFDPEVTTMHQQWFRVIKEGIRALSRR